MAAPGSRQFYRMAYLSNQARWDSGVTPPEIVDLIEREGLAPGRALDLGCGTGTNAVYLARHGWQVTGIDFVRWPIRRARQKARQAGVSGQVRFLVGDVISVLGEIGPEGSHGLAVDIGCGHSLGERFSEYAGRISRALAPGGVWMLYVHHPHPERHMGMATDQVEDACLPWFDVADRQSGIDTVTGTSSTWYRLHNKN